MKPPAQLVAPAEGLVAAPALAENPDLINAILGAAWESTGAALMVVDADATILLVNSVAMRALTVAGLKVGDNTLTGRGLPVFARPDGETPGQVGSLRRALAGERVREVDVATREDDGPSVRYRVSVFPFTVPGGDRMVLAVWRDITSLWETQERFRSDLDRLNRLMTGAVDYAIVLLGPEGDVLTWGATAERLMRWREADVLGHSHARFFTPEDRADGLPERTLDVANTHGRAESEGTRVRGDGTRFWAREVLTAQHTDGGDLSGFVRVSHDITLEHAARRKAIQLNAQLRELNDDLERRVLERTSELELANRELEAFSYSVSHDLRAPLRGISGFAQLLGEDSAGILDDTRRHYLDRIQGSTRQMGELIDGLLALSRVHRENLADEPFDMTDLARLAWESVVPAGWRGDLHLADLPPARGDRRLVFQVWVNLLENAVKFTGGTAQPRITVTSGQLMGRTAYRVSDNGAGFDDRYKAKLFTPFQRLHRAEDYPGTGVGLALVARIVRRHGGSIDVDATEHEGATFWFTLAPPLAVAGT